MASWWVEYSLEAGNYLADNGELVTALFFAMEALAEYEGWPPTGASEIATGLFAFEAAGHLVTYRRDEENRLAQIEVIKPLEDEL